MLFNKSFEPIKLNSNRVKRTYTNVYLNSAPGTPEPLVINEWKLIPTVVKIALKKTATTVANYCDFEIYGTYLEFLESIYFSAEIVLSHSKDIHKISATLTVFNAQPLEDGNGIRGSFEVEVFS